MIVKDKQRGKVIRRFLALVMLVSMLLAACGGDGEDASAGGDDEADPQELQDVTFAVSTCSPYAFAFHLAGELGFFEEEGLNVEMQCVDGSTASAQQAAAGNADISAGNAASALPTYNQGVSLHPFFAYTRGAQADVMVMEDSDIQSLEDLRGKSIGVAGLAGAETPVTRGYLATVGVDPDTEVELIEVGADPAPVQLAFDRDEIQATAATQGDLGVLISAGLKLRSVVPDELKEQLSTYPSGMFFANEESKDDTDMLAAFSRAVAKGYIVGFVNPDATNCILADLVPEEYVDPTLGRAQFDAGLEFAIVPENPDGTYSFSPEIPDSDLLQGFLDFYLTAGILEQPLEATDVIVDVTDEIHDFDQTAVIEMAEGLESDCPATQ